MSDIKLTLPDGSVRVLPKGSTGFDLASDIGPGLAKASIAVTVNGEQKDINDPINDDSSVSIITIETEEGLEIMRHTLTAQVLARALAKTCAVRVCLIISRPSSVSIVIIETEESSLIGSFMSFCSPLTVTAIDALASPGPISEAKSKPVDPLGSTLTLPSGNVNLISDILLLIFYILVFYRYFYKLNSLLS